MRYGCNSNTYPRVSEVPGRAAYPVAVSSSPVPQVVRLLADPVRWRLLRQLARGDLRVRELVAATDQPQNLVSYHLRQLRDAGLVTARRSSLDARDTYYSLDLAACSRALASAASDLHAALSAPVSPEVSNGPLAPSRRVLFVCTGNSSRSPMAEALLRHCADPWVQAASAGIRPKPLHPTAVAVMRDRYRIDISSHRPTHVETVADQRFDYVISLCDKAREVLPDFGGQSARVHWSLPDPTAGDGGPRYAAFERVAAEIHTRVRFLLPVLARSASPG
jgi:protein-tyrosine-phosphatase/DNA-binding transcriptional ArsR family regulator